MFSMVDSKELPVSRAASVLPVSRSGYYRWMNKNPPQDQDVEVRGAVEKIALEFPRYGYRRIRMELRRRGSWVNHKRVLRIMRQNGLLCVRKAYKPQTTQSNHQYPTYPNLVRDIQLTGLNQLWVADITYIRLLSEFVYLAVILDRHSRKCIGWQLGRNLDTSLTLNALRMALLQRKHASLAGLIHHSDQGVQYAATDYVDMLKTHGIQISMSRRANPYDNAFAESFMKTLKNEEVNMNEYETYTQAHANIKQFIEEVYNAKRLHSSLGYVPPNEFEQEELNTILA